MKTTLTFATLTSITVAGAGSAFAQQAPVVAQQPQPAPQPVVVQQAPVGTTTTTGANYDQAQAGGMQSAEKTMKTTPNKTFLSVGIGTFGISYVGSVVAAAVSTRDADQNLYIPVVGPWLDLGERDATGTTKAMLITSGIAQGAGALLVLGSFFIPEKTEVEEKKTTAKTQFMVTPVSYQGGAGLGAVGRF